MEIQAIAENARVCRADGFLLPTGKSEPALTSLKPGDYAADGSFEGRAAGRRHWRESSSFCCGI
jgi:hypothetical protein